MKENGQFYKPQEVKPLYPEIARVYQQAFSGEPWFEVSKCMDGNDVKRCVGGFSSLARGELCGLCANTTNSPAYEIDELIGKFEELSVTRETAWYLERDESGITLAAIAWKAKPKQIFNEKYADVPEMQNWLDYQFNESQICWLDEVFADRTKKPAGNLTNFGKMCVGLDYQLCTGNLAFRTINPRMIRAAKRDFDLKSKVYRGNVLVPDRRDFVSIDLRQLYEIRQRKERGCIR